MIAFLDSYILPGDGDDIAPAWDRAMATTAAVVVATPWKTYEASRTLDIARKVIVVGWLATFFFGAAGFRLLTGSAGSMLFGVEARSVSKASLRSHAFEVATRCALFFCTARKFGGDGFHVAADVTVQPPTNANGGLMVGCDSTGHAGRGFSWRGGDANAWTVIAGTTSACVGDWIDRVEQDQDVLGSPRVGGFHDMSFLGTRIFGSHSGVHTATGDVSPLGYCMDGDAGSGLIIGCYQEGNTPLMKVRHHNTAIANLGQYTADSDGAIVGGRRLRGRWEFSRADAIDATLTLGTPGPGSIGEIKSKLDGYGYGLVREPNPQNPTHPRWWVVRWGNIAAGTVLAFRADAPGLLAPLGLMLGAQKRLLTVAATMPTAPGTVGDVVLAATPTPTLDGWRFVTSPNGSYWRAFVWGAGA